MKNISICILIVSCSLLNQFCTSPVLKRSARDISNLPGSLVIQNVNVIPVHKPGIDTNMTVVITRGILTSIEKYDPEKKYPGVKSIPGSGLFLVPAFSDMHVHLSNENDLILYIANGVLLVRNMARTFGLASMMGFPDVLKTREKVRSGKWIGPEIITAGPIMDGKPRRSPFMKEITTVKQAEKEIASQKKSGVEFIKIYDILTVKVFDFIDRYCGENNIVYAGHVPKRVPMDRILSSNMKSIEHLMGYVDNDKPGWSIPESEIEQYAQRTAAAGIWNCPTLVIYDNMVPPESADELEKIEGFQYIGGMTQWMWNRTLHTVYEDHFDTKTYAPFMMETAKSMIGALYTAGAKIVVGTDANFVGVVPGFATHREMELLAEAGMKPWDILRAATLNAARLVNLEKVHGSIEVGKTANLVLLRKNPLVSIQNTRTIQGVIIGGRFLDHAYLEYMLQSISD